MDTNISDLFFNTQHEYKAPGTKNYQRGTIGYTNLEEEATDMLASLNRLGIGNLPTSLELVKDFLARL